MLGLTALFKSFDESQSTQNYIIMTVVAPEPLESYKVTFPENAP